MNESSDIILLSAHLFILDVQNDGALSQMKL